MPKKLLSIGLLMLLLSSSGCTRNKPTLPNPSEYSILQIQVDWGEFGATEPPSQKSVKEASVSSVQLHAGTTVVGTRLVYPKDNAVFMQSLTRAKAEQEGIITMQVPPTAQADLLVMAGSCEREEACWYGTLRNIVIEPQAITRITMDQVEWVSAEWQPRGIFFLESTRPKEIVKEVEGSSYQFSDGTLSMKIPESAKSEGQCIVFVADVRDPYQPGPVPNNNYRELIVRAYGFSVWAGFNENGWRPIWHYVYRPSNEAGETERHMFQPAIGSEMFNLSAPSGYEIAPRINQVAIEWI